MKSQQKLLGITGWKNAGKTTLTERLVADLVVRGYQISTIKHAHHAFDIDHEGRDSWRHRKAGASEVAIVSSKRWAIIHELEEDQEPPLGQVLAKLEPCDLIIIEGYKREGHPKIEVRRNSANHDSPLDGPLAPTDSSIIAIASDIPLPNEGLPVFDINDISSITNYVVLNFLRKQ